MCMYATNKNHLFAINKNIFDEKATMSKVYEILLEENSTAVIGMTFKPPVQYLQYSMNYLNFPITYTFKESVDLKAYEYNIMIGNIEEEDRKNISDILHLLNNEMVFNEKFSFINCESQLKDQVQDNKKYKIRIIIKGVKINNSIIKPIWKILNVVE